MTAERKRASGVQIAASLAVVLGVVACIVCGIVFKVMALKVIGGVGAFILVSLSPTTKLRPRHSRSHDDVDGR